MTPNEEFAQIVRNSGYTRPEIAEMLGVSLVTINNWMLPESSQNHRSVKPVYLEMLRLKLGYSLPK